jgi:hypothetical protein
VVKVPLEIAAVVQEQVAPIVRFHLEGFTAWGTVREQMERLAFDA